MSKGFFVFLEILELIAFFLIYGFISIFCIYFIVRIINFIIRNKQKKFKLNKKKYTIIILLLIFSVTAQGFINMNSLRRSNYTIYTDKVFAIEDDKEYSVALIADIHYGSFSNKRIVELLCDELKDEQVDIIVFAGDILDENSTKEDMEYVFSKIGSLESKYGNFYINGNHDKQLKLKENERAYSENELYETITKNNIIVLSDEIYKVNDELTLIGREDALNCDERKTIKQLSENTDSSSYVISIDHKPCEYQQYEDTNVDLLLAGHTHNGQLWPLNIVMKLAAEDHFLYGFKSYYNNKFNVIITSGIGGWMMPIKNTSPAEYVIVNIKSKKS